MKNIKLKMMTAKTCGNKTAFVVFPVDPRLRSVYAKHIMSDLDPEVEQVGFITPAYDGPPLRMDMAGGEFCANATRAYGLYLAKESGIEGKDSVLAYVSGAKEPVEVRVDMDANYSSTDLPPGAELKDIELLGKNFKYVAFTNIVHLIVEEEASQDRADELLDAFVEKVDSCAYGVIFFNREKLFIHPYVYVVDLDSKIWETSCGSGSAATLFYLHEGEQKEIHLGQEGGVLDVAGRFEDDNYYISVGSPVEISDIEVIELNIEEEAFNFKNR